MSIVHFCARTGVRLATDGKEVSAPQFHESVGANGHKEFVPPPPPKVESEQVAAMKARIAELEHQIDSLTAPSASGGNRAAKGGK